MYLGLVLTDATRDSIHDYVVDRHLFWRIYGEDVCIISCTADQAFWLYMLADLAQDCKYPYADHLGHSLIARTGTLSALGRSSSTLLAQKSISAGPVSRTHTHGLVDQLY